jgi:four helix bundle protein
MATFKSFEEIEAWQKARELTRAVYDASKHGPLARDFALRDQMRSSSVSVMSNIAEGFERGGNKEFVQFPAQAGGSAAEVRSHLYVAADQGYLESRAFDELAEQTREICRMLTGLMECLQKAKITGPKFR